MKLFETPSPVKLRTIHSYPKIFQETNKISQKNMNVIRCVVLLIL